jgi:hypothetical protein
MFFILLYSKKHEKWEPEAQKRSKVLKAQFLIIPKWASEMLKTG